MESLGGSFKAGVAAVSWGPGRLDVFTTDFDDRIMNPSFDRTFWSDFKDMNRSGLAGDKTPKPVVVSWGPNRLDLFRGLRQD